MSLANATPTKFAVDVHLLLTQSDHVLLSLRQGTFLDGRWNLPSWKVEAGENAVTAMVREAREELALELSEDDLTPTTTVQCRNTFHDVRIGLFFHVEANPTLLKQLRNAEPHKCAEIAWFPVTDLPAEILVYSALGIELHQQGQPFGTVAGRSNFRSLSSCANS